MSWSGRVMASLDARASVIDTTLGDVQLARESRGPPVLAVHGGPGGFDLGATLDSGPVVRLSYEIAARWPALVTPFMVDGVSAGLSAEQKRAATEWITSDPARLQRLREQWGATVPREHRRAGWRNDQANEAALAPVPFGQITAPTLIAHGANDAIVPLEHATSAAEGIADAQLIIVEEGHHLLSLSREFGPVARRQSELAHG